MTQDCQRFCRLQLMGRRSLTLCCTLLALQVGGLRPAPALRASNCRRSGASTIRLGLVFPDSQEGTPAEPRTWRKGTIGDGGTSYWWRPGEREFDEPEVTTTAPADDWKVGKLANGREFLWREGDDPNDPEINMLKGSALAASEPEVSADGWRIGVLASGRRYLWRGGALDPEVRFWESSTLDSGKVFWYTADGKVSLTDPYDLRAGYTEL